MNEEEKKIIDRINKSYDDNTQYVEASAYDWKCIVDLIEKQQKKIKRLKDDKRKMARAIKYLGTNFKITEDEILELCCKEDEAVTQEQLDKLSEEYISKDKIREFKNKFIKYSKNEKVFMTQSSQINASLIQFCNELLEERN